MKNISIKTFVATGIGAALFFVLGRFVSIPVFANTSVNLQYAVLAFFAVVYGPLAGMLIGLIGHALIDLTAYGSIWWSWVIATTIVGLIIGILGSKIDIESGVFDVEKIILFEVTNIVANGVVWFLVAPTLDILIFQEPANKVFAQGAIAGISNMITTGVIGALLLFAYSKTRVKKDSLKAE